MELFEQCTLGGLHVNNRLVRSATWLGMAQENGSPTKEIEDLYINLAKGGIGTIITSYAHIADYEQSRPTQLGIHTDELISAYKHLTARVHEETDAKIVMQIVHCSSWGQAYPETAKILGPSAIAYPGSGIIPKEMTKEDIESVINLFANAARRVKESGFDGVQLHVGHSYLLAQFVSPLYNNRTDEYGGSAANRFRIVEEVFEAVRKEVGPDFPIWAKMNSSDEQEGGMTVDEFLTNAKRLDERGIDCIEVSGECWIKHKRDERAYYADAAVALGKQIDASVILTGGLREKKDILPLLESGSVKFFGFCRPLIKNPEFALTLK